MTLKQYSEPTTSLLNGCMASALRHACAHAYKGRDIDVTVHAVSISVIAGDIRKMNGNGNHQEKGE